MKRILLCGAIMLLLVSCAQAPEVATPTPGNVTAPEEARPATATPAAAEPTAALPTEPHTAATEEPVATTAATPEPEPTAPVESTASATPAAEASAVPGNTAFYEGITFNYDSFLATGVGTETVPGTSGDPGVPYWANYPSYTAFNFEGYLLSSTFHNPRIEVYPAAEYASLNVSAREQIEQLNALLAERPDDFSQPLPFLPLFNAAQVLRAQVKFLPFTNGEGIRYIAYYAQDAFPVTNQGIFYTYQGLTDDGEHYVSAIFPVRTDVLPDEVAPDFDYDAFIANLESYQAETTELLNDLAPGDFTPDLTSLDAIVQSLRVMPPEPPRRMGDDGNVLLTITRPVSGGQALVGETMTVEGYGPVDGPESVDLELVSGMNTLISMTVPIDTDTGDWQTTLDVPLNVVGPSRLIARTEAQEDTVSLQLLENIGRSLVEDEPQIRLFRPILGETVVAGYPAYFAGDVQNPIDDIVTVGVLIDNCSRWAAQQSFTVEEGPWTGLVVLPEGTEDENACAVAYTGEYGEGNWREMQMRVPVLSPADELVNRISLEQVSGLEFPAGGTAVLRGVAIGTPEVLVTVKDPSDDTILAETTAAVGDFGTWEASLPIPEDAPDFVVVDIQSVEEGDAEPFVYSTGATVTR